MSKINDITAITSRTLDRYRNSIPRKAFIEAMEAVAAEVVGQSETAPASTAPGIQIINSRTSPPASWPICSLAAALPSVERTAPSTATTRAAGPAGSHG